MQAISPDRFSELVGRIYDCAIEPERWPETIRNICEDIDCFHCAILLIDLQNSRHRVVAHWNAEEFAHRSVTQYGDEMTALYRGAATTLSNALDVPLVLTRDVPEAAYTDLRYYNELVKPAGICDSVQSIVLRDSSRIGVIAANRHARAGKITNREVEIVRLLAPHLRRAVTISDLMDIKKLEAQALSATLDNFQTGVIVVAIDGRVLHANDAAHRMFAAGGPVRSVNGRLSTHETAGKDELNRALILACKDESSIGASGIGIALSGPDDEPAIAHVLPLANGDLRTRLMPQATAAVFVSLSGDPLPTDMSAIARAFSLTPAEARLLEHLMQGTTLIEVARELGISEPTAKTHLSHIFSKTGVTRQAELVALINRLRPPVKRPTT